MWEGAIDVDIFRFWARIGASQRIHPADRAVFGRIRSNFNTECLPNCMMGPLRTAPVVLLYLSPGLSEQDRIDARSAAGRERYRLIRQGRQRLPGPDTHESAWRWWTQRTKTFTPNWELLRDKVAFLNIGSYHSNKFEDNATLASLPSSRVSIEWAQSKLFPSAIAGKRIVICSRSPRFWGLEPRMDYGVGLFAPRTTRSSHMMHGPMRTRIVNLVRRDLRLD
jgi:hypothetical protein